MSLPVVSWRVGADNKLEFKGLLNTLNGTYPTDATVTVTVRNRAGTVVTGLNAVAAAYVAGTTGVDTTYRTLAPTAAVTPPLGLYEAEAIATRAGITGREFATITVEKG
jgi:hypothetical protein